MKIKMISSEDKEEWLKETYNYLQKLKEDKYGDVRLDYIMLYELHKEEHKEIERLSKEVTKYDEILGERNNEVDKLYNIINELENGLKEEIDRLEKVALENKNNKFEFDKLVLIRGKVMDIYDELKELKGDK